LIKKNIYISYINKIKFKNKFTYMIEYDVKLRQSIIQ